MTEERVWYLKCKICGTLHSSGIVVENPAHGPYELPICTGGIECPSNPGKKAECSMPNDWVTLTESEVQVLLTSRGARSLA
jgi:hypothetical protein